MTDSLYAFKLAFLLIPLLILLGVYVYLNRKKKRPTLQFSSLSLFKNVVPSWRSRFAELPLFFKILAGVFFVFALARPQKTDEKVKRNVEGIDIMIVLDISDSMLIEDMKPENRMEASKLVISNFIKGRTSDRIGLVVFAGEAYTRVPLTLDYELLLENVKLIKPSRNIKMGTAIGVALATGVGRLKDSKAKSRVMIFLTDGENNSGTVDPETAIQMAVDENLKVYSIGMGRDGEAQLPVFIQDAFGNTIKQYRPMHSKVNEPLLKSFAEKTGGRFWRANTGRELDDVFKEINQLEKTKIDVEKYNKYTELFSGPLQIGLFMFVFALILSRTLFRSRP